MHTVAAVAGKTDSYSSAAGLAGFVADVAVVADDVVVAVVFAVLMYWNFHPNRPNRLPSRHCCYCW